MIAAVAVAGGGILVGVGTLALVRDNPDGSLAGSSALGAAALLVAGWALIAVGLGAARRRPGNRVGPLVVAAGFTWFIAEWNNPGANSSVVFTVGLLCYAGCPPIVAHAVLSYPSGRLGSGLDTAAVATAYAGAFVVLGLAPALAFEPADQGCSQCAANLVAIASDPGLVAAFNRVGVWMGMASAIVLAVLAGWRLVRSTPAARRMRFPVAVPGIAYLGAVASAYAYSTDRGALSNDDVDRRLWLAQALTLVVIAEGFLIEWMRARRARSAVAGIVVELAEAPLPGGLRQTLARSLGDPGLDVAYPVLDGRYVDAGGTPIGAQPTDGRATTALLHGDQTVAVLVHRKDLLGDRRLVEEVASAATLAFENERLHAEASAQLAELRTSRARLVTASDAERRRLERDLHDGAQQRLVGLTLATRLLRQQLEQDGNVDLAEQVGVVDAELRRVVDDVRELASGIYPAVLADYGLAAAVRALAERPAVAVRAGAMTQERFPAPVENAAYAVVAAAAMSGPAFVTIACRDSELVVDVETAAEPAGRVDLEDRVGALDGTLTIERIADGCRIRAEIPCA
jgi:signal transduction histidine kinase